MIELRAPKRVIGRNTRAAMQSGVVLGEVARIDGLLDAMISEMGLRDRAAGHRYGRRGSHHRCPAAAHGHR